MAKFVEVDVRGLSCPEPVLLTMDAMEEHPGEMIRVLGDEAHTRKNIEKMLEYEHKDGQTTTRAWLCFTVWMPVAIFVIQLTASTFIPR